MSEKQKRAIRVSISILVDVPADWDEDQCRFYLVENHCRINYIEAIARRIAKDGDACNVCPWTDVEMLVSGNGLDVTGDDSP